MKSYLAQLSQKLFADLKSGEDVSLELHSEESDFIRFNHSKVRQNTVIRQHELTIEFHFEQKIYKSTSSLTLQLADDLAVLTKKIQSIRQAVTAIDPNPQYFQMQNNGQSEVYKKSQRPSTIELISIIAAVFNDSDLAGLWCSGPIRRAAINSKGQFQYFENDSFFFDYSLYNGPRAAKGFYSDENWNEVEFKSRAQQTKNTLALLSRVPVKVNPAAYRAYLGPMAVAEIFDMVNVWQGFSRSAFEKGFAPLKKLHLKEKTLTKDLTIAENNLLGLAPHFNSLGEISPEILPVIERGELKNFLVSSATAKEYSLPSNQASPYESMRSYEVKPGNLEQSEILKTLDRGLYLSNLHYLNWSDVQTARITGMTRFACFWVENGEIVGPIQDLRFDDSLFSIFGDNFGSFTRHQEIFTTTATYQKRSTGGCKVPGAIFNSFNFTS
ncbi:MAG: Zn-dependent protease [Bdellovibrionaceae bacterium]|nr:Zn-dependent protease [Bdellovibrio sp.]